MSSAASALYVSPEQREVLESWARSHVIPHRQVQRARVVLLAADGVANEVIAVRLGTSKPSVLSTFDEAFLVVAARPEVDEEGHPQADVARILKVSRQSVSRWHESWRAGGLQALKT